jgi:hypothetical protein
MIHLILAVLTLHFSMLSLDELRNDGCMRTTSPGLLKIPEKTLPRVVTPPPGR